MQYQPPVGSTDPNAPYIDFDLGAGIRGSKVPASAIESVMREIENAIRAANLVPDGEDTTQLAQAIVLLHRIDEDRMLFVPGEYANVQDALEFLNTRRIASTATVTIKVAAGEHSIDEAIGPMLLAHPDGHRIRISGATLTGTGFPTAAEVNNSNAATVEALLRTRFPTVIECAGEDGLYLKAHALGLLENVLFIGDGTGGASGILAGKQATADDGRGLMQMQNVWCHRFAGDGVRAHFQSAITGHRVGATHNGVHGFRSVNGSNILLNEYLISARNTGCGLYVADGGEVEAKNASSILNNTDHGARLSLGVIRLGAVGACEINGHGNTGKDAISAIRKSTFIAENCSFSGNTRDLLADEGAYGRVVNPSPATPTSSPALNTVGNQQSYISKS